MAKLFGTDGVRGVAGRFPLTADFVRRLGWAAGQVFSAGKPGRKLLMVRDTRASGPALARALADGLSRAGVRVLDGGVLPTPSVAALARTLGLAGGAVISASHNPAEFNGVKFFDARGFKLDEKREAAVESLALSDAPLPRARGGAQSFPRAAALYMDFLKKSVPGARPFAGLRVVLDCAHGAASRTAPAVFRALGARVSVLSNKPDGKNINRGCGALHPEKLAREVRRRRADFGAAFDGDADRAILVDETGAVRDGDAALLAAARRWLSRGRLKSNTVAVTVMTNLGLFRALKALGIETETTSVGDKYVWRGMEKTGAVLGGEPSGHVIFRDFLPTGDGTLTALQILAIVAADGPLSALAALAVTYPQVLLNVPVREKKPLEKIPGFTAALSQVDKELGDTGRTLIRYSGTEPLLRVMIEGPDPKRIAELAAGLARLARG